LTVEPPGLAAHETLDVRPYQSHDAAALAGIHNEVYAGRRQSSNFFQRHLAALLERGGCAWVVTEAQRPVAYAALDPVPGLAGLADLQGVVALAWQRRGLGTLLMERLLQDAVERGFRQVAHAVTSLESGASRFLQRQGFTVEHEEWRLVRDDLRDLPPLRLPARGTLQTYPAALANDQFRHLYQRSFASHLWYQPYSADEVAAELQAVDGQILFLTDQGEDIAFAWPRLTESGTGVIEPVGVAAGHQGRGYGRAVVVAALHWLSKKGANQVAIGVWRQNEAALHLYQALGFRHQESIIYLAHDIKSA
jgi:mycothiol synthase